MLSSKARILWIKYHAYVSCFFLPLALLYAITGLLYLLGFTGEHTTIQSVFVASDLALPQSELAASALYESFLVSHPELPAQRPERFWQDDHMVSWWNVNGEIMLIPDTNTAGVAGFKVVVDQYDWLMHLHFIHKGLAGTLFEILGVLMAVSLLVSIITGVVIALAMPKLKRLAVAFTVAGLATLIGALLVS